MKIKYRTLTKAIRRALKTFPAAIVTGQGSQAKQRSFQSIMAMIKIKRVFSFFLVLLAALIGGCEEKTSPVAEKINPVAQYGDNLISVHEGARIEGQQATLKGMKNAIQIYYASNGKYPENIYEIQKLMDSPIDPDMHQYNPQNGMVTLKGR